uniref:PARP-type domain-containing protein n=1 Tax=Oryza brachyantha TaxID=4533 RepID=J3KTZ3_ORYBR
MWVKKTMGAIAKNPSVLSDFGLSSAIASHRFFLSSPGRSPIGKDQLWLSEMVRAESPDRCLKEAKKKKRQKEGKKRALATPASRMAAAPKPRKGEYSKFGRSSCKSCRSPVGKDQL